MVKVKKYVALALGATCLLSACNKTVNAENAKKFIESNYGDKVQMKDCTDVEMNLKGTCDDATKSHLNDIMKGYASWLCIDYKDNSFSFNGVIKNDQSAKTSYLAYTKTKINANYIDGIESKQNLKDRIYTVKGKEMSVYFSQNDVTLSFGQGSPSLKMSNYTATEVYRETGQIRYEKNIYKVINDGADNKYDLTQIITYKY